MSIEEEYLEFTLAGKMVREGIEKKIEEMAELLYKNSMRSENWTDIIPFRDISKEYRDDLLSLATKLYSMVMSVQVMPTGGGL